MQASFKRMFKMLFFSHSADNTFASQRKKRNDENYETYSRLEGSFKLFTHYYKKIFIYQIQKKTATMHECSYIPYLHQLSGNLIRRK